MSEDKIEKRVYVIERIEMSVLSCMEFWWRDVPAEENGAFHLRCKSDKFWRAYNDHYHFSNKDSDRLTEGLRGVIIELTMGPDEWEISSVLGRALKPARQDAYDGGAVVDCAGIVDPAWTSGWEPKTIELVHLLEGPEYALEISKNGKCLYCIKPDGTEWRSDDFSEEYGLAVMFEGFSRRGEDAGKRAVEELKSRGLSVTATFRAVAIGMAAACRTPEGGKE